MSIVLQKNFLQGIPLWTVIYYMRHSMKHITPYLLPKLMKIKKIEHDDQLKLLLLWGEKHAPLDLNFIKAGIFSPINAGGWRLGAVLGVPIGDT